MSQLVYLGAHTFDFTSFQATPDKAGTHLTSVHADSGDDYVDVDGRMPEAWDEGNVDVILYFASTSTASGNVKWDVQFERLADNGTAITGTSFSTVSTTTSAVGTPTVGSLSYATIGSISALDGLQAGEYFRMRIQRDTTDAADTLTGDAALLGVSIDESTP